MTVQFDSITLPGVNGLAGIKAQLAVDCDRREVVVHCDQLESAALIEFAQSLPDSDVITRVRDGVATPPPYQLLIQLWGRLHRARVTELADGSRSFWLGDVAGLRDERARESALRALNKLAEFGLRGIAELDVEGALDIHVELPDRAVPRHIVQAVDDSVLFDESVYMYALLEGRRHRSRWSDARYVRDGVLREFDGEAERLRWLEMGNDE